MHIDYDHLRQVCSTADLSLPTRIVDSIGLGVGSVRSFSDALVVDARAGAHEATLKSS